MATVFTQTWLSITFLCTLPVSFIYAFVIYAHFSGMQLGCKTTVGCIEEMECVISLQFVMKA
jgi:hypothetical protein